MVDEVDGRSGKIATGLNFGGASAGAQDGAIADAGAADDETDYEGALAGRKGGMVHNDTGDSYVDTSEFGDTDHDGE